MHVWPKEGRFVTGTTLPSADVDASLIRRSIPSAIPNTGSIVRLVGSHRAIEERATVDAVDRMAKRRAAAELDLRLLSLQEEVQQRIASDLHDSTCQHLIAASLNVMRLRRALKR